MADQGTYNALNGKEVRDALFIMLRNAVDKLPMLGLGNSFHKVKFVGAVELSAFPTDVPIPDFEKEILIETPEVTKGDFKGHFDKLEDLLDYREKLIAKLQEVDEIVNNVAPAETVAINAGGDQPDVTRIEVGLPVPVLRTVGDGRKAEVNVPHNEIVKVGKRA